MPILSEDNLRNHLRSGVIAPVYILFGDDGFLKKQYAEKLSRTAAAPDDVFNYFRFEGDCDLQPVYDALTQMPIMAEKKCVLLCDYDFEHCGKDDFERLTQLTANGEDSALFLLWFDSVEVDFKKSAKFKKLISAAEKCGGYAVRLDHRKSGDLVKTVTDGAKKRGCMMEGTVARYLIETVGEDLYTLQNELDKLCAFLPNGTLRKEDVDFICIKTPEARIYQLTSFIIAQNAERAFEALDELFFYRYEPLTVLSVIASYYVDLYRVYAAKKAGQSIGEVAKTFGYKNREFVLENAARALSKFSFQKLSLSFEALVDADRKCKSFGADARVILEQLIVRLIYIVAKGEKIDPS